MNRPPIPVHSEPLTRQHQWHHRELPVLTMTLSLPRCQNDLPDSRARRINRYYETFAQSCKQYAERFLLSEAADAFDTATAENRPFEPHCFSADFSSTLLSDTIWSVTLETHEETFCLPHHRRFSDTWDLRFGYPLSLAEFFPGEPFFRHRLRLHAKQTLLHRQDAILHENWRTRLRSTWNSERFYLSVAGLHWYYPMYALGGAELGFPTFFLPWSEEKNPRLPPGLSLDKSTCPDL